MKPHLSVAVLLALALSCPAQRRPAANEVVVDASAAVPPPETGYLHLGGTSSDGHSLQINSRYLVLDGRPWLPVMGEFHFSRYPESEWEEEILKMKAGGVDIVSTYVFWIHQEEVEGTFDWSGRRDLRRFVQLCAKHHMYVWLRIGPWAHGEVRNGGFPDWVAKLPNTHTNDPVYLRYVQRYFDQIGEQVRGLMFKDGGPVIGTQLENEYGLHGPGRGAEHILKLKQLAIAAGIDTPLYSVTGWPSLDFPPHDVLPVSGGYPDGFWYGSRTKLPPSMNYLFNFNRELGDMGATVASEDPTGKVDLRHDPYFAAEQAGGMASSYHRRPVLTANDIAALTLTGLGSGVNLYGYYMFQGGANPRGRLSTLQESTREGKYQNDLPEADYDFAAPLGAFGQERESYRKTRLLHLFLNAYGSRLAPMPAYAPVARSRDAANVTVPRVAVRTDGRSGFVFVNDYVRQLAMPARPGFQVRVKLADGEALVPAKPVDLPAGCYFLWPFNLPVGGGVLRYATAQLLTQLETPAGKLVVFFAVPGVAPEFSFESAGLQGLSAPSAVVSRSEGVTVVRGLLPGRNATIRLTDRAGKNVTVLLLSQQEAEGVALFRVGGAEHLIGSASAVFFDGQRLHMQSTAAGQEVRALPELPLRDSPGVPDGLWTRHRFTQPEKHPSVTVRQTREAAHRPAMQMGPYVDWRKTAVPVVPPDSAFQGAAAWTIEWRNPDLSGLGDALLQIDYTGDVARLESRGKLLDDDFFNGLPWQVGLRRFGASTVAGPLTLEVLPMPRLAPVYLEPTARALLERAAQGVPTVRVKVVPVYESVAEPVAQPTTATGPSQ